MEPAELLKKYFGYDTFRPMQEDVIKTILSGRDVLAVMPTGAGKSVCFQIPALLFPHGTIIISPLISLMKDQVEALAEQGISASYVNSTVPFDESIERLRDLFRGRLKLLYMAPEKLEPTYFTDCLSKVPLSMVVIDEAHCVSQWGHDFRPSYQKIKTFIDTLPAKPVVTAFTATATSLVEEDMKRSLGLGKAAVFRTGLDRPNLSFRVIHGADRRDFILRYVQNHGKESGIIYCATRKAVDEIYEMLTSRKIKAGRYHAGMEDGARRKGQEDFSFDRIHVMVATNAFGMGIDKSNVRYVLHYQMPKSMEAYYQEAGRAGRDGAKAECILLYSGQDVGIQRYLIESGNQTDGQKQMDYDRLYAMDGYCSTTGCLRNYILNYFGETADETCGRCGNCESGKGKVDITDEAVLIFRTVRSLKERYGAGVVADILKGSRTKMIRERNLDSLPTYGRLSFAKIKHLRTAIHFLIADGYLKRDGGESPLLHLTEKAEIVLERKAPVLGFAFGAEDVMASVAVEKKAILSETKSGIFEKLRRLRLAIAREEHVPPFVVFSDATLEDMVSRLPRTEEEMAEVHGIGAFKLKKYGERFLAALGEFSGAEEMRGKDEREEKNIYEKLERLRRSLAKKENLSTSQILSDTVLRRIAETCPATEEEFRGVKGIGPKKADKYAEVFLQALHPERSRISPKTESKMPEKREHVIPKTAKPVRGRKGKITAVRKETIQAGQTAAIDIETRAFFLYLKKVRARLAKETDLSAESICADRDLEKMVKSETVSDNLPAAVKAEFEKVAQERILDNIRKQLSRYDFYKELVLELRDTLGKVPTAAEFFEASKVEPHVFYNDKRTYARLCADAGIIPNFETTEEEILLQKAVPRMLSIDSTDWIFFLLSLFNDDQEERCLTALQKKYLRMWQWTIWGKDYDDAGMVSPLDAVHRLSKVAYIKEEIISLLIMQRESVEIVPKKVKVPYICPLDVYANYTRDQIFAALGFKKPNSIREGVKFLNMTNTDSITADTDVFLVTLNKSEKEFSDTTLYEDYSISKTLFHWQSQSTTSDHSKTGQRYIQQNEKGNIVFLFVRKSKKDAYGKSMPYTFLGTAHFVNYEGSQPMSIIYRLDYPIPAKYIRTTDTAGVL